MTFDEFKTLARSEGLYASDCGDGHWQLRGAAVKPVNYYQDAKDGPTLYVSGSKKGIRGPRATVENAIHFARTGALLGQNACRPNKGMGRGERKARRRELFARDPHCHWCRKELRWPEPTLDHIIATSAGGSDYQDNLCIACLACNRDRGNVALPPRGAEPAPVRTEICMECDGCGWYEGGAALQTHCKACDGTGVVPHPSFRAHQAVEPPPFENHDVPSPHFATIQRCDEVLL